jgi:hypothetical protein
MYESGFESSAVATLSDEAWRRVNELFFSTNIDEGDFVFADPILAADGAEWAAIYFRLDEEREGVSLIRNRDKVITSFGLNPNTKEVRVVSISCLGSLSSIFDVVQFQVDTGYTYPTETDLRPLEEFLLPQP